jgi:hypothetical protein
MIVVGLGHRARHGKNTVAKTLVTEAITQGIYAKEYGFADALRAYCRVHYGMRKKDAPLLQRVGTDEFRAADPNIWVRVLMDTIEEQSPDMAVITDVRFPNEAEVVKSLGGIVVNVRRITDSNELYVAADRDPFHPSECALDNYSFDWTITCRSGDLVALRKRSGELFNHVAKMKVA